MNLSIAFLQLLPEGSLEENLKKGIAACRQAKEKGADIAIFPEMWSCGYNFFHDADSIRECAISYDSSFVNRFSELAAELDLDMLRDYRLREVWGHKHRRPELYGIIAEE
ncbi:nitrilase-related carbon-nitrogen hydrolase [Butyrivibrio sp. INlla16]|uniref:nitrilase-related carbon-nitrogen hydrolase n=1 Tax=Butyrivibrio sp. INlla16 TaxID=1520807 RepID=UPI00088351B5|nr:nitrilase-related carbon-nitrogen hydrolase [Butyrivibrio sp. INlla16]SDB53485.1 Carbon-nitrogen hydrolase [Butyrivibrio sp. INlla16]